MDVRDGRDADGKRTVRLADRDRDDRGDRDRVGHFFKSDNILLATGGNVPLGVAVFLLGGIGIVFGGLCLGELAARTARPGGVIAYAEDLAGPPAAAVFGWFQVFVYLPAIITVVSLCGRGLRLPALRLGPEP